MNRPWVLVVASLLASSPAFALAGGHGGHSSSGSHSSRSSGSSHSSASTGHRSSGHASSSSHRSGGSKKAGPSSKHSSTTHKSTGVRGAHGKIKRDPEQRARFMRSHPCPSTGKTHGACRGYVVDHVQALKHGGRDDPSNMQWQSVQAAKAKDKWE